MYDASLRRAAFTCTTFNAERTKSGNAHLEPRVLHAQQTVAVAPEELLVVLNNPRRCITPFPLAIASRVSSLAFAGPRWRLFDARLADCGAVAVDNEARGHVVWLFGAMATISTKVTEQRQKARGRALVLTGAWTRAAHRRPKQSASCITQHVQLDTDLHRRPAIAFDSQQRRMQYKV
ncbi:hypothetical protein MKEN_00925400 [Mycena kentingensis (nom. inval.)]|nr:hypothetical protein MKEN_00925400 [Mycena kentingensis (nom. inval.)]